MCALEPGLTNSQADVLLKLGLPSRRMDVFVVGASLIQAHVCIDVGSFIAHLTQVCGSILRFWIF